MKNGDKMILDGYNVLTKVKEVVEVEIVDCVKTKGSIVIRHPERGLITVGGEVLKEKC